MKKVLSIFLPFLSTELLKNSGGPENILLTTSIRGRTVVARTSPAAAARGVESGTDLSRAAKDGDAIFPFKHEEERASLEALAHWAYCLSPIAMVDPFPQECSVLDPRWCGIHLDVSGMERLIGTDQELLNLTKQKLQALKLSSILSIAPTIGAAWAFSRYSTDKIVAPQSLAKELSVLPVSALRLPPAIEHSLIEVNLRFIGDLLSVSRASLLARFDAILLSRIDQALGKKDEPLIPTRPKQQFKRSRSFASSISCKEALLHHSFSLLSQFISELSDCGKKVWKLKIAISPERYPAFQRELSLNSPSINLKHIWGLVKPIVESAQLPAAVEEIAFIAANEQRFSIEQTDSLRTNPEKSNDYNELLDKLFIQLGQNKVMSLSAATSHIPERSYHYHTVGHSSLKQLPKLDRPSIVLDTPLPINTLAAIPDSAPVWIKWKGRTIKILSALGPERIGAEWWNKRGAARDYFKIQLETGLWLWIYRESSQWFIHGLWG